jgi:hypothetical protein
MRHDGVDLQSGQLRRESGECIELSIGPPILDAKVATFLIPEIPQTLAQGNQLSRNVRGRCLAEKANAVDALRCLRPGGICADYRGNADDR